VLAREELPLVKADDGRALVVENCSAGATRRRQHDAVCGCGRDDGYRNASGIGGGLKLDMTSPSAAAPDCSDVPVTAALAPTKTSVEIGKRV
jgi:hypothetical protein